MTEQFLVSLWSLGLLLSTTTLIGSTDFTGIKMTKGKIIVWIAGSWFTVIFWMVMASIHVYNLAGKTKKDVK